jgi:hypothetical protein
MVVHLLSEDVTILEFTFYVVVTNEPLKFALVYTVSVSITELINESIQTRFGGVGLPSTIKDLKEVITHSGNMVAVEIYFGLFRFRAESNTGVGIAPVAVVVNSSIHQSFDLTHVWCRLVDFYTIQDQGASTTPCVPLSQLAAFIVSP